MEHITCPHCQEIYGVNGQILGAEGQDILCKKCDKKFQIKIYSDGKEAASCMKCGDKKKQNSTNYAGKPNLKGGGLFIGDASTDYLCIRCKNKIENSAIDEKSNSVRCIVCKRIKEKGAKNFAGKVNIPKGTLFPGRGKDYLCPTCKSELEGDRKEADKKIEAYKATQPSTLKSLLWVLGVVVLLVFSVIGGLKTCTGGKPLPEKVNRYDGSWAYVVCKNAVKARLKSPSTADFPWGVIGTPAMDGYLVKSYVDSQNGFGAVIRTRFTCVVDSRGKVITLVLN